MNGTVATLTSLVVIFLAATVAPLLADQLRRRLAVPATVLEILLGILVGPALLGLARTDPIVDALANFGLALLFFFAGYEINFQQIRGGPLTRASASWGGSLLLGLILGALLTLLLGGGPETTLVLGLALVTTALGTILPMVRDTGVLATPLGPKLLAVGAVGEFGPVILIALLLSGVRPLHATVLLLTFLAIAAGAALLALRTLPVWLSGLLTATLGTSAQFAVRLGVLIVLVMVWLATELHLDLVLGAFAAGVVMRLLLGGITRPAADIVVSKLEGIGFGLLIPFFFVTTGVQYDLAALLGSPTALALVPLGAVAFLLVRGVPVALAFRTEPPRQRAALGLYAATALPIVVVVTSIGATNGWITAATAAGLVGAAMLSVLVYPVAAQRLT